MKVVLAEKPSVARDIARQVGANSRQDGYLKGGEWAVTWAFGHLVELCEPEDYRPEWRSWRLENLPIVPEAFVLRPRGDDGAKKQLEIIKQLFVEADEIICATDAGREGELIFRYILQWAKMGPKPIRRLWISSLTASAIQKGFSSLAPASKFENLYQAARCRSEADWIVGLNATRFFTVEHGKRNLLLSIGRVQTPILAMVVDRDRAIEAFAPEDYWEVHTYCRSTRFRHTGGKIGSEPDAQALLDKVKDSLLEVKTVQRRQESTPPPLLFDLTELQREMNRRQGFTADQTLRLAQSLYEKKHITYPRTDSRYLTTDLVPTIAPLLRALRPLKEREIGRIDLDRLEFPKRLVDDSKVSDHHAILPTEELPGNLSDSEKSVYDAILLRFLAGFYPACLKAVTTVDAEANKEPFRARGTVLVDAGWQVLYPQPAAGKTKRTKASKLEEPEEMPDFQEGERLEHEPKVESLKTTAPRPLTEASLLQLMETAGRVVTDESLKEALKEKGVGTPATRASIIEVLIQREYVERQKKNLVSTPSGRRLIALVPDERLKSPQLTGEWEYRLKKVERGEYDPDRFMREVVEYTKEIIDPAAYSPPDLKNLGPCPLCGKAVMRGRAGYGCSHWREGCKFALKDGLLGLDLTPEILRELLSAKRTVTAYAVTIDGEFRLAYLWLGENGELACDPVEAVKANKGQRRLGTCPICQSAVVTGERGYGCSNWRAGCRFVVWKKIAQRTIAAKEAKTLMTSGSTETLDGFVSRAGKPFSAKLAIKEGKVVFDFTS